MAFIVTMTAIGLSASSWSVLALPCSLLIGFAFASAGMAITSYMRTWVDFEFVTGATQPLFLFSATFYPAVELRRGGLVIQLSPLYHGVALIRSANIG